MREKIIIQLKELQDLKYKKFNKALIPDVEDDKLIGVRLPEIRKIAKNIAKTDGLDYFNEIIKTPQKELYHEEKMLAAMTVAYGKISVEKWCALMDQYVSFIDNWAICDSVCSSMKNIVNKHQEEVWDYLQKYLEDSREYYIRFGVVMAMDYFINDQYIDKFLQKLKEVKTTDYYAMMAVAWALSVAFVKYEDKTMEFIKSNCLDITTHNKAIQKIRESNRVDKKTKMLVAEFKRKV